jgi:hypothetical protein
MSREPLQQSVDVGGRILTPRERARRAVDCVLRDRGVTWEQVTSRRTQEHVVGARCEAMRAVAEELPRVSLSEIARMFCKRPSTVVKAFQTIGYVHGRRKSGSRPWRTKGNLMLTPEDRVNQSLRSLPYPVSKPLRDVMVELVRETEVDCAAQAFMAGLRAEAEGLAALGKRRQPLPTEVGA